MALLQRTCVFHSITPFPWLFIYPVLNLTAIAKCAQLISSSNQNQRWFTLQNKKKKRKGKGREEEKEEKAEDGSKDPAGLCVLPNRIYTVHPTALQWPHPGPSRSNFLTACFLLSLVLQPAIPGHQTHQTCTA